MLLSRPALPRDPAKIVFLCGCAESSRDGVGDYTALLAEECERRGCATFRIALNDGYVSGVQRTPGLLRLGAGMGRPEKAVLASEAVEQFGADLVSLQWVPYAFDDRGIPWGVEKSLLRIAGGRPAHVMCHEIWIGAETGARLSHRLTGAMQRIVMLRILEALRPGAVHTSNAAYAGVLRRSGIEAEVLPMFGAIPVTGVQPASEEGVARFGMFGELHPVWPPEPLLGMLRAMGKRVRIEHIGRIGKGEGLWREMERRYGDDDFEFRRHGEQPVERISEFFAGMDFGIATTPLALQGKSASAAAMLEHGLPVIVNRNEVRYPDADETPEGVIVFGPEMIDELRRARRRAPRRRLADAADQFLASVQAGVP